MQSMTLYYNFSAVHAPFSEQTKAMQTLDHVGETVIAFIVHKLEQ